MFGNKFWNLRHTSRTQDEKHVAIRNLSRSNTLCYNYIVHVVSQYYPFGLVRRKSFSVDIGTKGSLWDA